jgi:Domain of unknown function (DUF6268)
MQRSAHRALAKFRAVATTLALLTATGVARAQLVDSVAAASFEYYPSSDNGDYPGQTQVNVARASAGLPIRLNQQTTLVAGVAYELVDVHSSQSKGLQLHAPKASFGVLHDFSEHWGMIAVADAGLASDLEAEVSSDDLLLSLVGIATYAVSDSFKLGVGAIYDRRSGTLAPLPAMLLKWRIAERVRVRGFAPVWLNAEYRTTDWLDLGVRSTFEGNRFHLGGDQSDMKHVELAYSNLTIGPKATLYLSDWVHLDVYAAAAVYRRYELFQEDESFARYRLSPVIGYGARLWFAPSEW